MATTQETRDVALPSPKVPPRRRTDWDPTKEEADAANAGKLTPRGLAKFALDIARNHPVQTIAGGLALAVVGAAVVEASQRNTSEVHQTIPSKDLMFDPAAESGTISPNKRLAIPIKDIDTLDESGNPLFLIPLILGPDESIEYE